MEYIKLINIPSDWGVGLLLNKHTIEKFIRNSPAFHSDLITNDVILSVDDVYLENGDKIHLNGTQNSLVKLKCIRNNKTIIYASLKRSIFLDKKWYQKDLVTKN